MIYRKSVGVIPFSREDGKTLFLLLLYGAGHWDFPKGGVEEGENEVETGLRELKEETGLDPEKVRVVDGFRETISYFFRDKGELIKKEVVFFVAEATEKDVKLSSEHTDAKWLGFEEALKQLTHKNARELLAKANAFIKKRFK